MKLNKMGIILLAGLFLYGCAPSADMEPESYFSISDDNESYYNAIIEDTLNSFYWRYDSDSIYYEEDIVPSDEAILACSDSNGYNMSGDKGKSCIKASANLLYFNRESAGTVYFYFVGNSLSGLYYTPFNTNIPCSLHVRNAYLIPDSFSSIETSEEEAEYTVKNSPYMTAAGMFDSVTKGGVSYSIFTDGVKLMIYRSDSSASLSLYKTIDYSGEGLIPISATFINDTTESAVLLGTETHSDEGTSTIIVPEKIVIFDSDFNASESEIAAEDSDIYSVGYDNGYLMVARSRYIDYYPVTGTAVGLKQGSYYVGKSVTGMEITDMDGDGQLEYIFTDGLDLFIFHKDNTLFKCIWSTHFSIDSFENFIYTGDMNRDGVKEIYVFDSTGTTSKYAVGENGMYTENENIEYGQRYHIADFNGDGDSDCLLITGADVNTCELRIVNG